MQRSCTNEQRRDRKWWEHILPYDFDENPKEVQLKICLAGISTRKINAELWYPIYHHWEILIHCIVFWELWNIGWEDKKADVLNEINERVFGNAKLGLEREYEEIKTVRYSTSLKNEEEVMPPLYKTFLTVSQFKY